MSRADQREHLGLIGGTGPQGRGLAVRWARAGHVVHIGSRSRDKAERVAGEVAERAGLPGPGVPAGDQSTERLPGDLPTGGVHGVPNDVAAEKAELIVVTLPYQAQAATLTGLADIIGDKVVVNVVNPMTFDEVGPKAVRVEAGSAAEECRELLPQARVVSAFHNVPARRLWQVDQKVDCDVLICGDDDAACQHVAGLAGCIPGVRGVRCGPLRNSAQIENMTPVLLSINKRYGIHAAIRIDGIPSDAGAGT